MALDDFEKELFNDLDGYSSNLNLDQEWQELEERLPKKKKRRLLIWWLSGLAGMLIMTSILFYNNKNTKSDTASTTTSIAISKDKVIEQHANQEMPKEHQLINQKLPLSSENKNRLNSSIPNTTIPNTISTSDSKNIKQPLIITSQNHLLPKNTIADQSQIAPTTVSPKPMEKINLKHLFSPITLLKISNITIEIQDDYYLKNRVTPPLPSSPQNNKIKPNWSIAFGYTYGTNQFNRTTSNADIQNQIDFLSDHEKQVDYMGLHFNIYRSLNKKISLFTGISANQHTSLFQLDESFVAERNSPTTLLEEHFLLIGIVESIYGDGVAQYDVSIQSKLWQKYQSIGIPLGISFHSNPEKRWNIQNDLAFLVHPLQATTGKKILRTATDYSVFSNNTYQTKVFTSFSNQFTLNYNITHTLSLQFGVNVGVDFTSRLKTQEHFNLQFNHLGIGFGGKIFL